MELAEDYSPHQRILRKYRADFFQSFKVFYESGSPRPTRIPHNIRHLNIAEGSDIFLKKLIKHNKGLKHITLHPPYWGVPETVANTLKYSKGLCSITFQEARPIFSEKMCRKMPRNWSSSIERVEILDYSLSNRKNFTRVINTILQFPKLKEFRFLGETRDDLKHFPFAKLQERNIAYDVRYRIEQESFQSLMENQSEPKPVDCLTLSTRDFELKNDESRRKNWKIQELSQKTLHLDQLPSPSSALHLLLLFENISSLDLSFTGKKSDYSSLGPLNNLKHLSLDMSNADYLEGFVCYFHENVAQHSKLEAVFVRGNFNSEIDKESMSALIHFFEICSKTLRKANFEFRSYYTNHDDYLEYLYEVLSKLKGIQSLSVFLCFDWAKPMKQIEELGQIISGMQSLGELSFKIKNAHFDKEKLSLTPPSQLKKLSLGRDTLNASFDLTKTVSSLSNLVYLELESDCFYSGKWNQSLEKLKSLEVLVLKEVEMFSFRER